MSRMFTRSTRAPRVFVAAGALTLIPLMSACGSSSSSATLPAAATPSSASADSSASSKAGGLKPGSKQYEDAMSKFTDCMSSHGMKPMRLGQQQDTTEEPPSQATIDGAWKACKPIMDKAGIQPGGGSGGLPGDVQKQFLAVAKCMRDKGWDVPDPKFTDNRVQMAVPSDPAAQKVATECQTKFAPQAGAQ